MPAERLQKILARAGLGSRRRCEEMIAAGRVAVNGRTVTELGLRADPEADSVTFDGATVRPEATVTYLLNKPKGYVCTSSASQASLRAVDLVADGRRLYVAGRLDAASQGLLVVTNDGELTQLLTHPSHGIDKEYFVATAGRPTKEAISKLRKGVHLAEGLARAKSVRKESGGLLIVLTGGMNRQIRRMLAKVGLKVRRLERCRIGFLRLGRLAPGEFRRLSGRDVARLKKAARAGHPRQSRGQPKTS